MYGTFIAFEGGFLLSIYHAFSWNSRRVKKNEIHEIHHECDEMWKTRLNNNNNKKKRQHKRTHQAKIMYFTWFGNLTIIRIIFFWFRYALFRCYCSHWLNAFFRHSEYARCENVWQIRIVHFICLFFPQLPANTKNMYVRINRKKATEKFKQLISTGPVVVSKQGTHKHIVFHGTQKWIPFPMMAVIVETKTNDSERNGAYLSLLLMCCLFSYFSSSLSHFHLENGRSGHG